MSATVPMSVWNNVRKYFKEHLDDKYDLQDVIRYKNPMDSYLYMVIAKHKNYSAIKACGGIFTKEKQYAKKYDLTMEEIGNIQTCLYYALHIKDECYNERINHLCD